MLATDADVRLVETLAALGQRVSTEPRVGIVLGSGLGAFADTLAARTRIPYADIPHLCPPAVPGHSGFLSVGQSEGVPVACLSGRIHRYEGHHVDDVVRGCRLLAALGCRSVLLTNAAGGIRADLTPGSFMLIVDHLNLTGDNPLIGKAGPFVDMTRAYDEGLLNAARRAAVETSVPLAEGVYAGLLGPSYETPAEIRMLKTLGADAVGMSTVLEAIALRHVGVRVGAMSCITNFAAGLSPTKLDHREVQEAGVNASKRFGALLGRWVALAGAQG